MGDVFTILVLTHFGPGPALTTYWLDIIAAHLADVTRRFGLTGLSRILLYRFAFNLACCAISVWMMHRAYALGMASGLREPADQILGLAGLAVSWFLTNTVTVSLAVSLWSNQTFLAVWREGLVLYLLNFSGSAAAAGLIAVFYEKAGFFVFLLALPLAVVLYQLYLFYIDKYEQARAHIAQLNKLHLQTIEAMSAAIDAKDPYTHGHIRRVAAYAVSLAECAGIRDESQLMALRAGALLHDIGKIAIPEYILNKPTVLTESEYDKMRIHPVVGANMLKGIDFPYPVEPLIRSHHERWDGNGYPDGLSGENIPLGARIMSIVDCYDALTTNRPYRSPMARAQVIEFFRREAGRAYDPSLVEVFVTNLNRLEAKAVQVNVPETPLWDSHPTKMQPSVRPLERVQPVQTYDRALRADSTIQRELYSIFEFSRSHNYCLTPNDVLVFMGAKLENLLAFDAAVFYIADLDAGIIRARHRVGAAIVGLQDATLRLEQKLSGWVAANNQSLTNLPPFPDFLDFQSAKPDFQNSCIVPLNKNGVVYGALAIYRKERTKFQDEEFRRAEILASQTSLVLSTLKQNEDDTDFLTDAITGIPNGSHLFLMFDQVANDADRFNYGLALLTLRIDDSQTIRRKFGHLSVDESLSAVARYLATEMRDTDILVRYAHDEFMILAPKLTREGAEALMSRLQNELDHFRFRVRSNVEIPIPVSIGLAVYPHDGMKLEGLIETSELRLNQDLELRRAVKNRIRPMG